MQEGEEKSYSAEVEREAQRLQASLGDDAERMPAEQERAEMLQEFWDEGYGAEGDDEAYGWDTDEWHEEAQATATGQEKKSAASAETNIQNRQIRSRIYKSRMDKYHNWEANLISHFYIPFEHWDSGWRGDL